MSTTMVRDRRGRFSRSASTTDLNEYPLDFLRCRVFGHAWEEFVAVGMRRAITGFRISLRCTSCSMERHDAIDHLGQVAARHYAQPDGYYLGYRVPRSDARLIYNKRRRRTAMMRRDVSI